MTLRTLRNRVRCYLHVVWQGTPALYLLSSFSSLGIEFPHNGDIVIWTWPWTRQDRYGDSRGRAPFISLGFTGTGEWGDARYWTLKELDADWQQLYEAECREHALWDVTLMDGLDGAPQPMLDTTRNLDTTAI